MTRQDKIIDGKEVQSRLNLFNPGGKKVPAEKNPTLLLQNLKNPTGTGNGGTDQTPENRLGRVEKTEKLRGNSQ